MDFKPKMKETEERTTDFEEAARGAFLGPVSCAPSDREILYSPGARFLKEGVAESGKGGILTIVLREI